MDGLLEAVDRAIVVVALLEYDAAVIREMVGYFLRSRFPPPGIW